MTFDEIETVWTRSDGTVESHGYTVSPFETSNDYRYITCSGSLREFTTLLYRTKVIDGRQVRMIFAVSEVTGGTEPELVMEFVKDEDLDLLPDGYVPGLYKDNVFAYRAPDNTPVYITLDAMEFRGWLGKSFAESGVDEQYIHDGAVPFNGYLFGEKVTGAAGNSCDEDICGSVAIYSTTLSYESVCEQFEARFGEGVDSDIPYVAGDGYTTVKTFTDRDVTYTVIRRSELPYIQITFDTIR